MVKATLEILTYLQKRVEEDWLIGYDPQQFNDLVKARFAQFTGLKAETPLKILLAETDPLNFLAAFLAAVAAECPIFLCNPNWKQSEWQQVFDLVQPDLILGESIDKRRLTPVKSTQFKQIPSNLINIPTGGSSGKIRFAMHTWETLTASVTGFHRYFGSQPVNSFCVLPLYHVSGLMQFLRSLLTDGRIFILPYKALKAGERGNIEPKEFFISLVPTQLQYLLGDPQCLSRFRTILVGGAPPWQSLLDTARKYNLPLSPTYGMTETASQVVTLKPEDFLAGNNSSGQVLPHAKIDICSETGQIWSKDQTGVVKIKADSLCLGYYPKAFKQKDFLTDDLGYINSEDYLHIVGRRSRKIITGGENVFPTEVEAAILATGLVVDVCVIGIPDPKWGQGVTAVYVSKGAISSEEIKCAIAPHLSNYKHPQYWLAVETLPRNAQGKVNYQQIYKIATDLIKA